MIRDNSFLLINSISSTSPSGFIMDTLFVSCPNPAPVSEGLLAIIRSRFLFFSFAFEFSTIFSVSRLKPITFFLPLCLLIIVKMSSVGINSKFRLFPFFFDFLFFQIRTCIITYSGCHYQCIRIFKFLNYSVFHLFS